jgi:chitinase
MDFRVLENNYANFEMAMGERIGQVFKNPNETWGVIEQLYLLKKDHRNLKTLLSIGGISNSLHFPNFAMDPKGRSRFVSNAISMMKDFGMDGIDIDVCTSFPSYLLAKQANASL